MPFALQVYQILLTRSITSTILSVKETNLTFATINKALSRLKQLDIIKGQTVKNAIVSSAIRITSSS
jgi:predicted transcriptional regulator